MLVLKQYLLSGLALAVVAAAPSRDRCAHSNQFVSIASAGVGTCATPELIEVHAQSPSPFHHLSDEEIESITSWLQDPKQGLNLTDVASPNKTITDNYIWHMEELKPNKTDVLAYLDEGKPFPRYARVVINEGGKAKPVITEYFVGPLPLTTESKVAPLDYFYNGVNGPSIGYDGRFSDGPYTAATDVCIVKYMSQIADITMALTGLAYYGGDDERTNSVYFITNPYSIDGTQSVAWSTWRRRGLANYGLISDLYIGFDFSGSDASLFKLRMIVFNNKVFTSVKQFREAFEAGEVEKRPHIPTDDAFLRKDRKGPARELEDRMAPTMLELDGKRYKVDMENKYVEYMGWQFYTRFDRDVGVQFYDIKFKNERILYELSLQDATVQYAGNNPFQSNTVYTDRYYGIGTQMGLNTARLVPGYDCPYHAIYWDSKFTDGVTNRQINASICIFETDIGVPITRRNDPEYVQATKGSKLVVRQVASIGNYDYIWDYGFWVDGTITVDAHASGYVQATYYRPEDQGKWGPRISDLLSGTLHTHVMAFKADFDLVDEKNTFVKTEIVVENVTQPWFPEHGEFEMMGYKTSDLETEDEGLFNMPVNGQAMYQIVNKEHKNKWGEHRGYRVMPGVSPVHLPSQNSPFFRKSGQFAKQQFAVSRQHDHEQQATATLNQNVPEAPMLEFWKYFNGESLAQEDLVLWFNLGMQHYTRAEDMPNTLMSEAHSSIMFAPQNWGNAELTTDLQNSVIFNFKDGVNQATPETNGVEPPTCFVMSPTDELSGLFRR
jgi:primary-amine oxidase